MESGADIGDGVGFFLLVFCFALFFDGQFGFLAFFFSCFIFTCHALPPFKIEIALIIADCGRMGCIFCFNALNHSFSMSVMNEVLGKFWQAGMIHGIQRVFSFREVEDGKVQVSVQTIAAKRL